MECRLYADGYTIVGNGAYLKFVSITEVAFNIQIVGGLGSFFNSLKDSNKDEANPVQKTLNDLNFTEVINRGYSGFLESNPYNYPNRSCFFAIADFYNGTNSRNQSFNKDFKLIGQKFQYPFVKFKSIIEKILSENGITKLESDVTGDLEYTNSCIPFDRLRPSMASLKSSSIISYNLPLVSSAFSGDINKTIYAYSKTKKDCLLINSTGFFIESDSPNPDEIFAFRHYTCAFKIPTDGAYVFKINISASITINGESQKNNENLSEIALIVYADDTKIDTFFSERAPLTISTSKTYTATDVEYFKFYLGWSTTYLHDGTDWNVPSTIKSIFTVTEFSIICSSIKINKDSKAAIGIDMPIKTNLPDITQEEFFKSFLQLFGLTVDIDADSNTMKAYTLNEVIKNKANAPDWSLKYNKGSGTVKFTIGSYAKKNTIAYKEISGSLGSYFYTEISEGLAEYMHNKKYVVYYATTSGGDTIQINEGDSFPRDQIEYWVAGATLDDSDLNIKSEGNIYVGDSTLADTYTLFDPIFKAAENNTMPYGPVNRYRYAKLKRTDLNTFDTGNDPTLLLFRYVAPTTVVDDNWNSQGEAYLYFVASDSWAMGDNPFCSVEAQAMIDKYYVGLKNNILGDVRIIEDAEFYLTPKDIHEYDPFIPVYIDYYGAYFYVNKIKNFVSGKLTKVDLVRI
jgi:hypothetical protein